MISTVSRSGILKHSRLPACINMYIWIAGCVTDKSIRVQTYKTADASQETVNGFAPVIQAHPNPVGEHFVAYGRLALASR